MRSKTKIVRDFDATLDGCPTWSFDGSSTEQATGRSSDCLLKPVALFPDTGRKDAYLVMSEVLNPDGTPHDLRLTGKHETQSIDKFSYGVSDRGASIRIPIATVENGWKGWLQDRRPNSSADPYKVASRIIKTMKNVPEQYAYVSNGNGRQHLAGK